MTDQQWEWYYEHPELVFTVGEPYHGALEGVAELYDMTSKLTILTTARPEAASWKEAWLDERGFAYDELIVEDLDYDKSNFRASLYIDDGLHNLDNVAAKLNAAHILVVDRPWNRKTVTGDPVYYERARGWPDLVNRCSAIAEMDEKIAV